MANTKIQSEQIQDGAITADKIADGAIVAAEVADNAITTAKINADAVTGAKIADDAIDSEHYTDGSIDTAHIADAQITVAKMAANSVDSDQYVDGSIDTVHIGDAQVTTAKITDGNISTAKIADNAVTSAKIDTNIDIAGTFDVTGATTLDSTLTVKGATVFNEDSADVDFRVESNGNANAIFVNGGDDRVTFFNGTTVNAASGTDDGVSHYSDGRTDISRASAQALNLRRRTDDGVIVNFYKEASGTVANVGSIGVGNSNDLTIGTADTGLVFQDNQIIAPFNPSTNALRDAAIDIGYSDRRFKDLWLSAIANIGTYIRFGGASNYYIHSDNNNYLRFGTAGSERMRINSSGDVLIGQTSQTGYAFAQKLVVGDGDANDGITIQSGSTHQGNLAFNHSDGTTAHGRISYQHNTNYMSFFTNNAERMRIDSSGNLLVGTTSTTIGGSSGTGNEGVVLGGSLGNAIAVSNGGCLDLNRKTSHGTILEFRYNGSSVGSISTNANSLPSDRNFKKDIEDLNLGLDLVTKLKPKQYRYKHDEDNMPVMYGVVAQDLETSLTEVGVTKNSSWLLQHEPTEDEKESDYALDYLKLTPILIKSIQEQQEQIEELKSEIEALKS